MSNLVAMQCTGAPVVTSDTQIYLGKSVVHTVTISQADAAPTAGDIFIRDSSAAGAGTVLFHWNLTTAVFIPFTVTLDAYCATGIYVDFTTTADVNVSVSYIAAP